MKRLLVTLMLLASVSYADSDKAAHFGVSYVLTDVSIRLYEKAFRMDKKSAAIFGSSLVLLIGISKEYMDTNIDGGDIAANIAGIALKNLVRFTLEF